MGIRKKILELSERTGETIVTKLQDSFGKQGHGKGKDIEQLTFESGGNVNTDINMPDHYLIVDKGVKAGRIPFGKKTGQKVSRYIQGLVDFFKKHGKSDKKALSFAIATAKVQSKTGMSTPASRRFSETGKRQQFIENTDIKKEIEATETLALDILESEANLILDEFQKIIS